MYKWSAKVSALCFAGLLSLAATAAAAEAVPGERLPAVLQIRIAEGEGAVHAAGSQAARHLTVEVTDETGRPVRDAAVSFRLPEEGPGGVFSNGLKTDVVVTGADGRATVWRIRWNRTPGPFQIRIVAARGQARAGTVVAQYLSEAVAAGEAHSAASPPRRRRRWLTIGMVAGAAVGSAAVGMAVTSKRGSASSTAEPPALSVGMPAITIGRP